LLLDLLNETDAEVPIAVNRNDDDLGLLVFKLYVGSGLAFNRPALFTSAA